jgi:hypothetical protein
VKKVYICSPYAGDTRANKAYARDLTRHAVEMGFAPIAPHLYLTEALDDGIPAERAAGIDAAFALLDTCDMLLFGCDRGISAGMLAELELARKRGIPILAGYYKTAGEGGVLRKGVESFLLTGAPPAGGKYAEIG